MTKALIPILTVAAVAGGVFAFIEKSRADELDAQLAGLREEVARQKLDAGALAKLQAELDDFKANNARLTRERDDAQARNKELAANGNGSKPAATPAAGGQQPDFRNMIQGFARQMDDPDVRKTMKAQQQQQISNMYESLFKKLNLSEEESKLVAELLADRNFTAMDKGRKLLGGKMDDASLKEMRKEIEGVKLESDSKLKGMLGEEKFAEMTTFEQTVGDRRSLDGVARSFSRKNLALEDTQKEALGNIMREERLKSPSNEIPDMGGGPGMAMLMTDEEAKARQAQEEAYQTGVLNRAGQAGLSPDQVSGLKDSFAEQNQRRAMSRIMGRAFLGGGAPPAAR